MATSAVVGDKYFRTKGELTQFIRTIVGRYEIGDFLNEEDKRFCLSLFESHSDYPQKLYPGVERIQLLIQKKGTRGFQIHKVGGESDDISWTHCVSNIK
jgi:hypothetical protein